MVESFVGSFLGVWAILALLWARDTISERRSRRERELEERVQAMYARNQRNSAL